MNGEYMSDTIMGDSAPAADTSTENSEATENTENSEELDASAEGEGNEEGSEEAGEEGTAEDAKKAKPAAKKEEPKKSNKKRLKIKVDQKEEEIEFDPENEEEIRKHLQLSRAAQKRMAEMADMKKDVSQILERLTKDPLSFLADKEAGLGLNVEDLVRQYVEQKLADAEKSPEQLKAEAMEKELLRLKAERESEKTEAAKQREEALLQNEIIRYDNMITKTLENSEFKKPTPYLVKKMSDYLILGVQNGIDVTTDDILPLVREEIQGEIRELINSAPEEVIDAMFGKEIFDRMRKKNVAKAKKQTPVHASSIKDTGIKSEKQSKETEKLSYKQYFKF
jgi:hypothetical protein